MLVLRNAMQINKKIGLLYRQWLLQLITQSPHTHYFSANILHFSFLIFASNDVVPATSVHPAAYTLETPIKLKAAGTGRMEQTRGLCSTTELAVPLSVFWDRAS